MVLDKSFLRGQSLGLVQCFGYEENATSQHRVYSIYQLLNSGQAILALIRWFLNLKNASRTFLSWVFLFLLFEVKVR